jgi:hypothetical protein
VAVNQQAIVYFSVEIHIINVGQDFVYIRESDQELREYFVSDWGTR